MKSVEAIGYAAQGRKIRRKGWPEGINWVCYVPGNNQAGPEDVPIQFKSEVIKRGNAGICLYPHYCALYGGDRIHVGWNPTNEDLDSSDWEVVDD